MKKTPPHLLISTIVGLSLLCILLLAVQATRIQVTGQQFVNLEDKLLLQDASGNHEITAIIDQSGQPYAIPAFTVIEEPDVLPTYENYNAFMQVQTKLSSIFESGASDVTFTFADGSNKSFALQQRSFFELPLGFFAQVIAGLICISVGASIWAFKVKDLASALYFFMGFSVTLSCFTSAVYTTRELYFNAELFRLFSIINHIGAAGFGSGLAAIFLCYPVRLLDSRIILAVAASFLGVFVLDTWQLVEEIAAGFHIWMLVFLSVAMIAAIVQWLKTHKLARERAILKWMLLSIIATSMIFTSFNIIPAAFMATTLGPQALTLSGFALGFIVMAFGLSRYKLFNLDRWWYNYWLWMLAGIVFIVIDLVLISLFHLSQAPALGLSLAVVGWLYFPIRQWLMGLLTPNANDSLHELLPNITNVLFSARSDEQLHQAWRSILEKAFLPLQIDALEKCGEVQLANDGQELLTYSLPGFPGYRITHAKHGRRLFTRQDIDLTNRMYELLENAHQGLTAREEGQKAERSRIRRDLHDDLGARLLSLSHSMNLDESNDLARKAIQELRYIISALEQQPCPVDEALQSWEIETRERLNPREINLEWQQAGSFPHQLDSRQRHNLSRAIRELVSNTLKHSNGNTVSVSVLPEQHFLLFEFSDNGTLKSKPRADSNGKKILQSRIEEIGGNVEWLESEQSYGVRIRIPLATTE